MDFYVGTFTSPKLYRLRFNAPGNLEIVETYNAAGGHSWLSFSPDKRFLYATVWSNPPAVAAYGVRGDKSLEFINKENVKAQSGYVTTDAHCIYSAGGPSGEVFKIRSDGGIGNLVQELTFVDSEAEKATAEKGKDSHGAFGGLRYGAHSVDLSPDKESLYIADIGRNCIWTYAVNKRAASQSKAPLEYAGKYLAPRDNAGPRHTWPHPNKKVLYSLDEHSSRVEMYSIAPDGTYLVHIDGVKIIPDSMDPKNYWADEVRLSTNLSPSYPQYLFASTRGLEPQTKGYVSAFKLDRDGWIDGSSVHIYETATSGGLANAIEPAPQQEEHQGVQYLAMTDSQEGWVSILQFDGANLSEAARVRLTDPLVGVVKAATAVWL